METRVRCFSLYGHVLFHASDTSLPSFLTVIKNVVKGIVIFYKNHCNSSRTFDTCLLNHSVHGLCK